MLTLTQDATLAIRSLMDAGPAGHAGIRIAAEPVDGAGPQLGLEINAVPMDGDQIIDSQGALVFLDPTAATMLDDETLDVQIDQEAKAVNFYLA